MNRILKNKKKHILYILLIPVVIVLLIIINYNNNPIFNPNYLPSNYTRPNTQENDFDLHSQNITNTSECISLLDHVLVGSWVLNKENPNLFSIYFDFDNEFFINTAYGTYISGHWSYQESTNKLLLKIERQSELRTIFQSILSSYPVTQDTLETQLNYDVKENIPFEGCKQEGYFFEIFDLKFYKQLNS